MKTPFNSTTESEVPDLPIGLFTEFDRAYRAWLIRRGFTDEIQVHQDRSKRSKRQAENRFRGKSRELAEVNEIG